MCRIKQQLLWLYVILIFMILFKTDLVILESLIVWFVKKNIPKTSKVTPRKGKTWFCGGRTHA